MVSNFKCAHTHTILFCLLICVLIRALIGVLNCALIDFCIVIDTHTSEDLLLWMFAQVKLFTYHRMDKCKTFFVVSTLLKSFSNKVHQIISFHGWIFYRRELLFHWNKFFELLYFSFVCFNFVCVEDFKDDML